MNSKQTGDALATTVILTVFYFAVAAIFYIVRFGYAYSLPMIGGIIMICISLAIYTKTDKNIMKKPEGLKKLSVLSALGFACGMVLITIVVLILSGFTQSPDFIIGHLSLSASYIIRLLVVFAIAFVAAALAGYFITKKGFDAAGKVIEKKPDDKKADKK